MFKKAYFSTEVSLYCFQPGKIRMSESVEELAADQVGSGYGFLCCRMLFRNGLMAGNEKGRIAALSLFC
jgi:hypothetical protein